MGTRSKHLSFVAIGVCLIVTCAAVSSGWAMLVRAEEDGAANGQLPAECGERTGHTPAYGHHLDPRKLEEAAARHEKLVNAEIEEVNEEAIRITVQGVTITIQGFGGVVIFHVPSDAPEDIVSAVHAVADEVNNAC